MNNAFKYYVYMCISVYLCTDIKPYFKLMDMYSEHTVNELSATSVFINLYSCLYNINILFICKNRFIWH